MEDSARVIAYHEPAPEHEHYRDLFQDEILLKYPHLFDESFITRIGSAKMDKIIVGINRIEGSTFSKIKKNKKISQLVSSIDTRMSVGEIESIVIQKTK